MVCRWPAKTDGRCQRCGWEPEPGSESETVTTQITNAQRDYDVRAAARVAGAMPLEDQNLVLSWLAAVVRGGPVEPGDIGEEMVRPGPGPSATARRGMGFALTRLVSGRTDALAFVELGADVVSTQALGVDKRGVPEPLAAEIDPWTTILPRLRAPNALRYLRMAGGIGIASLEADEGEPDRLAADLTENLAPMLEQFKTTAREKAGRIDVVLVHRTRMWSLLDEAAALARTILRPVTEITARAEAGTLTDVLHAIAAQAPLRYSYDLVLVDVKKRQVRPSPYELFPAGSVAPPGSYQVKAVSVSAVSGHAAAELVLPIVARRDRDASWRDARALADQRPVIAMATLDAATGKGSFQVRVQLIKPGVAEFLGPSEATPADDAESGRWPESMADLREQLWQSQGALDLVLLVELADPPKDVAARIRLVKDVVAEFELVPEVRIAVLGYRDHFTGYEYDQDVIRDPAREHRALIVGSVNGFTDQAKLGPGFWRPERWQAVESGDDGGAPVEDALWLIASREWNWRPGARHVVVIVGRRPPYSDRSEDVALACESHYPDWRRTLEKLRRDQQLKCLVVLDEEPAAGYALRAWQALTAPGTFRRSRHNTRLVGELARDCGMTSARLRFATLAGGAADQEGAA